MHATLILFYKAYYMYMYNMYMRHARPRVREARERPAGPHTSVAELPGWRGLAGGSRR